MAIERFLTIENLPNGYLMQVVLEELLPSSAMGPAAQSLFDSYRSLPKPLQRPVNILVEHIRNEVLDKIIFAQEDFIMTEFQARLSKFQQFIFKAIELIRPYKKSSDSFEANLAVYDFIDEKAEEAIWLDNHVRTRIYEITRIMRDFEITIASLANTKKDKLRESINRIDPEMLIKTLYGSYLVCVCISIMLTKKPYRKPTALRIIVDAGFDSTARLDGYTDSLDILSDDDMIERLNRAQRWEEEY